MLGFGSIGQFSLGEAQKPDISIILTGVAGTGRVGVLTPTVTSFTFTGVAGTGVARATTQTLTGAPSQAAGGGVAASVTARPTGILFGVAGVGLTNYVFTGFTPYTFVELVHFDAYPVIYRPTDMTSVTVVVAQAAGGGVAGIITPLLSGSGGEQRKLHDKRIKTGLLPLDARPAPPKQAPKKPLLPPTDDAPSLVPAQPKGTPPTPAIAPAVVDQVEEIRRQIMDAIDASDIEAFLKGIEQDEQDAADIADVLALLD